MLLPPEGDPLKGGKPQRLQRPGGLKTRSGEKEGGTVAEFEFSAREPQLPPKPDRKHSPKKNDNEIEEAKGKKKQI